MHLLSSGLVPEFHFEAAAADTEDDAAVMTCAFFYVEKNYDRALGTLPPGGSGDNHGTLTSPGMSTHDNCGKNVDKSKDDWDIVDKPTDSDQGGQTSLIQPTLIKRRHQMARVCRLLMDRNKSTKNRKATFFLPQDDCTDENQMMTSDTLDSTDPQINQDSETSVTSWEDLFAFLTYQDNDDEYLQLLDSLKTSKVQHSHLHLTSVLIGLVFGCILAILIKS